MHLASGGADLQLVKRFGIFTIHHLHSLSAEASAVG